MPSAHPCSPWPLCIYARYCFGCGNLKDPILWISDTQDGEVFEYGATLITLQGLNDPFGECVDAHGDTWITNFGGSLVEYARGGTTPIATLNTAGDSIGCSVAPNGDLAVANDGYSSEGGLQGNIQVFKNASGNPTEYVLPYEYQYWQPGYDDKGNLFVEGTSAGPNGVVELPAGGSSLERIPINWTINDPGGTMWDGKYITFTDQQAGGPSGQSTTIYQARLTKSGLSLVGSTTLEDSCNGGQVDAVAPFVVGKKNTPVNKQQGAIAIGGNLYCSNRVDVWSYPAGGQPIAVVSPSPNDPQGESVSLKP
jgi:hypothetical protein